MPAPCCGYAGDGSRSEMTFVLRMAFREMRASWPRLLFFVLCLALGVGAIVTLRSVMQTVRQTLTREARTLLGADLTLSTNRPWDPKVRQAVDARLAGVAVMGRTDEVSTLTMIRPADPAKAVARLVELRAVQAGFPLYGTLTLAGQRVYSHHLLRARGMLIRPDLSAQLGVHVGDDVVIGITRFTIRGVIAAEPARRAGGFSLGSRVYVDLDDLRLTGLLSYGSRAQYELQLKLPAPDVPELAGDFSGRFRSQFVTVRSYRSTEDRLSDSLVRAENYLSLVGLVIVVLGGVGVWSVVRVFIQQKLRTIAVLKCVGSTSMQILFVYTAQVLAMGFAGGACGVGFAVGALNWMGPALAQTAVLDATYTVTGSAVAQGMGIGVLVALLFGLIPLLDVRHVRPSLLLRESSAPSHPRDWVKMVVIGLVGVALVAVAGWQAASWRIGLIVSVGFAGLSLALHITGLVLIKATTPLQRSRSFAIRYAARRMARPGNQIQAVLLAVGLGAFLIIGVRALQQSLLTEFQLDLRPDTPDMFLIDIQPDQVAGVSTFLSAPALGVGVRPRMIPVLRARITAVKGRSINLDTYEEVRRRGELGREYVVTYRQDLERNERVVEGQFWRDAVPAQAEVSIERGLSDRAGLNVGDTLRFDILGRPIEARITSVRSVDWADARAGGFMFVFRPGALDAAPQTFIAPIRGPSVAADRARMQRDLTAQYPNVSVVDVKEMLASAASVIRQVSLGVAMVGSLVLFSGMLILAGSVSMTTFQRVYEAAILKSVGATSGLIAAILCLEYSMLGVVSGVIGSSGAMGLSWAVSHFVLELPWRPQPGLALTGVAATGILVSMVGVGASLDVLRRKPLSTLRAE